MNKQIEGQGNIPKWMRIFSLFMGVLLVGDGMRRFIAPRGTRDFYSFLSYIFVGAICLFVFGYSRRLFVNEEGLVQTLNIWGRKTKKVIIAWSDVERVSYAEQKNTFIAGFERGNKGYRISVDLKDKDSLRELVQHYYK
ncbi:MAG: hypothetical protein FWH52_01130 [Synergistaceae bacterium]|nr:hypothetical protein [Synergistaceae bacterium]